MLDLYDEFKAIVTALNEREIDYAVCGGLAMAVYGLARATIDIDLLIPADRFADVKTVVNPLGYIIEANPMTFAKGAVEIRRLSKLDAETGIVLSLDWLFVTPPIEDVWKSRTQVEWEGVRWPVVSREGLTALDLLEAAGKTSTISSDYKRPRMKVDMSAQAVTARLKRVSQLRRLCLSLAKAKPAPAVAASRKENPAKPEA